MYAYNLCCNFNPSSLILVYKNRNVEIIDTSVLLLYQILKVKIITEVLADRIGYFLIN